MVDEDCSWKGTFHLDRGFIFCPDCTWPPQISNLAYFFLPKFVQISRKFDWKSPQMQEILVLKMQENKVLNNASLVKSNSRHGEAWGQEIPSPWQRVQALGNLYAGGSWGEFPWSYLFFLLDKNRSFCIFLSPTAGGRSVIRSTENLANGLVDFAPSVGMYASFAGDLLILNCWQVPHPDM